MPQHLGQPTGGRTVMSRTSSVMAIASTPSLNASKRPVLSVLRRERSGFSAPATAPLPARPGVFRSPGAFVFEGFAAG